MPRDMFEAQNAPQTSKIKRGTEPYFDPHSHNASFGTFGLQKYILVLPYLTMDSESTLRFYYKLRADAAYAHRLFCSQFILSVRG